MAPGVPLLAAPFLRVFVPSSENYYYGLIWRDNSAIVRGMDREELSRIVVDCAYKLHVELGPGLLESVYEVVLAKMLEQQGIKVRRQVPVPIRFSGMNFDEGFRADILVEEVLLVELKSVETSLPVHAKQALTYLRLLDLPLGLLINFGASTFREGCKRIVNGPQSFVSSCLRVNQNDGAESHTKARSHEGEGAAELSKS